MYTFELVDMQGRLWKVRAFGVHSISRETEYYPPADLMTRFPELEPEEVQRVGGEIHVLMGMDLVGLHPREERTVGNQRLLASQFGKGKLLVGAVPGTACGHLDANAIKLSQGTWELPPGATVSHSMVKVSMLTEFEDLQPDR